MTPLSPAARAHFDHPRHVGALDPIAADVAVALVGEPVSGAVLQLHLRVDQHQKIITAVRFKAHGCGWAIACGSWLTEWLAGRSLREAAEFQHHKLAEALDTPPEKLHCAVLAQTALKAALHDYTLKPPVAAAIQSHHPS